MLPVYRSFPHIPYFSLHSARAHHLSSSQRTTLLKWNIRVSLHQLHPQRTHYRNKWNNDHFRVSIIPRSTPVHDSNATGSRSLQKKTLPNRLGRIEECSINPYLEGHRVSSLEKVEENSAIQFRCSGEIATLKGKQTFSYNVDMVPAKQLNLNPIRFFY